jgi:hypothetical protein
MKRFIVLVLLALISALAAGYGCYTMISHPATDYVVDEPGGKTCSDCHADSDFYHWTEPYYTSSYAYYPSTWGSYYLHPWWWNDTWTRPDPSAGGAVETEGRHAWDRGPGSPNVPQIGAGIGSVGGGTAPAHVSSDSTRTSPHQQNTVKDAPKDEPKKDEPKKNEENQRHGWRR